MSPSYLFDCWAWLTGLATLTVPELPTDLGTDFRFGSKNKSGDGCILTIYFFIWMLYYYICKLK